MFEWAYAQFGRTMDGNEERDRLVPAFRRLDVKGFARWKFYLGALILPIRFILFILPILFLALVCLIAKCCN